VPEQNLSLEDARAKYGADVASVERDGYVYADNSVRLLSGGKWEYTSVTGILVGVSNSVALATSTLESSTLINNMIPGVAGAAENFAFKKELAEAKLPNKWNQGKGSYEPFVGREGYQKGLGTKSNFVKYARGFGQVLAAYSAVTTVVDVAAGRKSLTRGTLDL
jgi:hypothetical protein